MSQFVDTPTRTFTAGAAIAQYLRVVESSSLLAAAGAMDVGLGTLEDATFASGDKVAVRLWSAQGTRKMVANGAITRQAKVYGGASGKVSGTANSNLIGIALEAASADGDVIEVLPTQADGQGLAASAIAASSAVTNTTTETAFDNSTVTFPANSLKAGDIIRVRAQAIATLTNSTDTLTLKLKIGSTVVAATAAVDVANNDVGYFDVDIVIRTIGASGTIVAAGVQGLGVEGTVTAKPVKLASTTLDTTAAASITVSATWSVQSSSNSVRLDVMNVQRIAA